MIMEKIDALLLDAGFSSTPILQSIMKLGFKSGVCGSKLTDPGHLLADKSFPVNYSIEDDVMQVVQKESIRYLLPGVTDVSYLTAAKIAEKLGLPGFDPVYVNDTLFKKDSFRRYALSKGFPVPAAVEKLSEVNQLRYPILVKPADAYSGRGIAKILSSSELEQAYAMAELESVSGNVVLEEFKEGSLHSHSAFIRDGRIVCEFFVDEYCTMYQYQVNSSCISVNLSEAIKDHVTDCIQMIITDLRLCDGVLHTQFITNGVDFWLIELTRRCPGDLYSQLIQYSTDIPYSTWFSMPFLGMKVPAGEKRPALKRHILRHTISTKNPAVFYSIEHYTPPCRVIETVVLKRCGENLNPAPFERAAIIFAECNSEKELHEYTPILKNYWGVKNLKGQPNEN
ncbi:carbamoyl-phosphate synthase small subunit [Pectobacterium versatile]|nr:carbamoyl-phosphate synthase small subunit [Pectobacterium versatile]